MIGAANRTFGRAVRGSMLCHFRVTAMRGLCSKDRGKAEARRAANPMSAVNAVELELKQEMAAALGSAERRLESALCLMKEEKLKAQSAGMGSAALKTAVCDYNYYRDKAIKLREELVIQRETAGFTSKNKEAVHELHPIPQLLDQEAQFTNQPIEDPSWVRRVDTGSGKKKEKGYVLGDTQMRPTRLGLPARNVKEWLGT